MKISRIKFKNVRVGQLCWFCGSVKDQYSSRWIKRNESEVYDPNYQTACGKVSADPEEYCWVRRK